MKKLIFLSGDASSGKTTTLKILIGMLLNSPGHTVKIIYPKNTTKLLNISSTYLKPQTMPSGDISVIIEISGVSVGIRTNGDTLADVWANIVFFENHKCVIGVTACHQKHLDRAKLCMVAPWDCNITFKKDKSTKKENYDTDNVNMAKKLYDEIIQTVDLINPPTATTNNSNNKCGCGN